MTEKCPNCGHSAGYWRSTSEDWRCRRCGYTWGSANGEGAVDLSPGAAASDLVSRPDEADFTAEAPGEETQMMREAIARASRAQNYGFLADDVEHILAERAQSLAEEVLEESETERCLLVLFRLRDEWYAIDVKSVREIKREFSVTQVPGTPAYISGVINLRGEIVSVTDLATLLGLSSEAPRTAMIVCDLDGLSSGLLVEELADIVEVPMVAIEAPLATLERTKAEHIMGQVSIDDRLVTILELERILTAIG